MIMENYKLKTAVQNFIEDFDTILKSKEIFVDWKFYLDLERDITTDFAIDYADQNKTSEELFDKVFRNEAKVD